MNTFIRFEHIPEGRMSEDLGPVEWVQLTYDELRVSPDGESYAIYHDGYWWPVNEPEVPYTDVVIWGK